MHANITHLSLECISRLANTTAGEIYIDGEDLLKMNSKQLIELRRTKMGMVFQVFIMKQDRNIFKMQTTNCYRSSWRLLFDP